MTTKRFITYHEYGKLMDKLVAKLTSKRKFPIGGYNYVMGVPRGGWPIAVHLAHHLKAKLITPEELTEDTNHILIVDDIVDSGDTLKEIRKIMDGTKLRYHTSALFIKPAFCQTKWPDFYILKTIMFFS